MNIDKTPTVKLEPQRDVWEKIAALSPILCGVLISAVGTYCSYSYNQQQLKIQQVQTIGSFIPHLMGNEQSKRASILALYTMTNGETASKFAQIFASSGTVSALQSITKNGNDKDKAVANQALNTALQNLAQQNAQSKIENEYEKKLLGLQDSKNSSYAAYNMNKLAQIYTMREQYDLAEPLLQKSLALRIKLYGKDSPEICDTLRALAEVYFMTGRVPDARANVKQARAIEQKMEIPLNANAANQPTTEAQQDQTVVQNQAADQSVKLDGMTDEFERAESAKDNTAPTSQANKQISGTNPQG